MCRTEELAGGVQEGGGQVEGLQGFHPGQQKDGISTNLMWQGRHVG